MNLRFLRGMRARKNVHPLLLEPAYWRNRLAELETQAPGVVWTPRPDLSGAGREVTEFRIKAHDGTQLWGRFARPTWQAEPWPATVRSVGPSVRPVPCDRVVRSGTAEFVFQEPAGRRLADRVLDVMQVCKVAMATKGIEVVAVEVRPALEASRGTDDLAVSADGKEPRQNDELLIVEQLLSHRIARVDAVKAKEA